MQRKRKQWCIYEMKTKIKKEKKTLNLSSIATLPINNIRDLFKQAEKSKKKKNCKVNEMINLNERQSNVILNEQFSIIQVNGIYNDLHVYFTSLIHSLQKSILCFKSLRLKKVAQEKNLEKVKYIKSCTEFCATFHRNDNFFRATFSMFKVYLICISNYWP